MDKGLSPHCGLDIRKILELGSKRCIFAIHVCFELFQSCFSPLVKLLLLSLFPQGSVKFEICESWVQTWNTFSRSWSASESSGLLSSSLGWPSEPEATDPSYDIKTPGRFMCDLLREPCQDRFTTIRCVPGVFVPWASRRKKKD